MDKDDRLRSAPNGPVMDVVRAKPGPVLFFHGRFSRGDWLSKTSCQHKTERDRWQCKLRADGSQRGERIPGTLFKDQPKKAACRGRCWLLVGGCWLIGHVRAATRRDVQL